MTHTKHSIFSLEPTLISNREDKLVSKPLTITTDPSPPFKVVTTTTKPILLIEDDLDWGELLQRTLQQRGFEVDLFVRARIARRRIYAMNLRGGEFVLWPEQYSVALVEGRLRNSRRDGWELVPILAGNKLKVIAMSGCAYFNKLLVDAGAKEESLKVDLFQAIISNRFHPLGTPSIAMAK